jgi:hypothetical protein
VDGVLGLNGKVLNGYLGSRRIIPALTTVAAVEDLVLTSKTKINCATGAYIILVAAGIFVARQA